MGVGPTIDIVAQRDQDILGCGREQAKQRFKCYVTTVDVPDSDRTPCHLVQ